MDKNRKSWFNYIKQFIIELLRRINVHDVAVYSTQMAFFFILSIFPLLIFTITIISNLNLDFNVILDGLKRTMPPQVATMLTDFIENALSTENGVVLSFSLIIMLYSSSKAVHAIMHAVNIAYEVDAERNFFIVKLISVLYTFAFTMLIVLSMAIPEAMSSIISFIKSAFNLSISEWFIDALNLARIVILIALFIVLIASIYIVIPAKKFKFREGFPGTIFAIIGIVFVNILFKSIILKITDYSAVYGSLSAVIAFMIWLNAMGMIIMTGAEINGLLMSKNKNPPSL